MLVIPFQDAPSWERRIDALLRSLVPQFEPQIESFPWKNNVGDFKISLISGGRGRSSTLSFYLDYEKEGWTYIIPGERDQDGDMISPPYAHPFSALEAYFVERTREIVSMAISLQKAKP